MASDEKAMNRKLDRRRLFKLAGAGAAGAALAGARGGPLDPRESKPVVLAQEEEDSFEWDEEVDVVVVGSGAAAGAAAVTALNQGSTVVVLEKAETYGGTSGKSGGTYWIPNNSQMREEGLEDPKEDALKYMARLAYPADYRVDDDTLGLPELNYRLIESFYDNGSKAIDALAEMGALQSIANFERPDYHTHLPEDKAPRGRHMNPRSEEGESGFGADLVRQLRSFLEDNGAEILLEHRAVRLVQNDSGRAVGLIATNADDEEVAFRATQGVVFGSGGFTHDPLKRLRYLRGPIFGGCAVPTSEGDFLSIAGGAGAALGNTQHAWWAQIVLEAALENPSVPNNVWQTPGDGVIQVNRFGHRVMNEKMQYNERTQIHFNWNPRRAEYTNLVLFMIYDERTAQEFAGHYPIPAEDANYVISGDTLDDLVQNIEDRLETIADQTGDIALDQDFLSNLQGTLNQFNRFAEEGVDRQFLRGEVPFEEDFHTLLGPAPEHEYPNWLMHPISEEGPYYCIILTAGTLDTKGGPVVNKDAQVLDTFGNVIPGLYGAGNCIASPAGQAYWSAGGTLGPALTFGYLAGMSATQGAGDDGESSMDEDTGDEAPSDEVDAEQDSGEDEDQSGEGEDQQDEEASGEPATHVVEAGDSFFEPEHITIRAGDSITWQNVGSLVHTATGDPDKLIDPANGQVPDGAEPWDSGNISPGEEFTHTFEVAGEYTYACIPHEAAGMIGSITVEE